MLDTNMVSYILKGRSPSARRRFYAAEVSSPVLSAVTEAELRFGLVRVGAGQARLALLDEFLEGLTVLPWGRHEALVYASLRTEQEKIGRSLAPMDMMIAAHAVTVDATLVTHDAAFRFVSGLNIEDWATDL
jgi:tRNA(fMet)-specific endonuclease VapC